MHVTIMNHYDGENKFISSSYLHLSYTNTNLSQVATCIHHIPIQIYLKELPAFITHQYKFISSSYLHLSHTNTDLSQVATCIHHTPMKMTRGG
jgi:hypothetical protein